MDSTLTLILIVGMPILLCFSFVVPVSLFNKSKAEMDKKTKRKKLLLYTLTPSLTASFCSYLIFEKEIVIVLLKLPLTFLVCLLMIWLFTLSPQMSSPSKAIKIFSNTLLSLILIWFYFAFSLVISVLPQATFIDKELSTSEKSIIEKAFNVALPQNIESDYVLISEGFMQGSHYELIFSMDENSWNEYKAKESTLRYEVKESKIDSNKVIVTVAYNEFTDGHKDYTNIKSPYDLMKGPSLYDLLKDASHTNYLNYLITCR